MFALGNIALFCFCLPSAGLNSSRFVTGMFFLGRIAESAIQNKIISIEDQAILFC
jgi:hypothetical protein